MDFKNFWLFFLSWSVFCIEIYKTTPIFGGRLASENAENNLKYQFIVSLQDVIVENRFEHFCGGSLINRRWILTAAHCLWKKNILAVIAVIGHEDISNTSTINDLYKLERVEYQNFQPVSFQNDIALVRLQTDFVGNGENFKPALLPDYGMKPNRNDACTIIGYGALGQIGMSSKQLLEANVHVITNKVCRDIIGHVWAPKKHAYVICAVGEYQDSCQGDSGGPLICQYEGIEYIYGIVSYGIACGIKGIPGIYTVTVPYVNWIKTISSQ